MVQESFNPNQVFKHVIYMLLCFKIKGMLEERGIKVKTGEFGAYMQVSLVNDGPVTIIIDTKNRE